MDSPTGTASTVALKVRSTKGCWTCRLRKKKCDETGPSCLRCESVNIQCHYGPRPAWIENRTLGKEELERIKNIVGDSASKKRAAYRERTRASQSVVTHENKHPTADELASSKIPLDLGLPAPTYESEIPFPKWMQDEEANLMMHYLDHVFFIQFRFHTPSLAIGGRGWLLSLLTRTKPLYHAALSLSALHQQSLLCSRQEPGGDRSTHGTPEMRIRP